jgi:hypothetical protein
MTRRLRQQVVWHALLGRHRGLSHSNHPAIRPRERIHHINCDLMRDLILRT